MRAAQHNMEVVQLKWVLPWGLLLLLASWRLPWHARVATAQIVLFPLSDLYSTLPLLLGWLSMTPPLAWVGAGSSWLWPLLGFPNTVTALWLFIPLPYGIGAALQALQHERAQRAAAARA